jgi:PTH1 family peptidyl-tRNA hydrolase
MKRLIVGLGNPGAQYTWTRHNAGFLAVDGLCARHHVSWRKTDAVQGMLSKLTVNDIECSLLLPMTFMNHSGPSVKKIMDKQGLGLEDILVICDDLSLPFGKMRLRASGSAGGHNGLKSIIQDLGSNCFARLRLGIDEPRNAADIVDYVLSDFTPAQKKALPEFINHALDCVTCWVTEGAQVAMNRFNNLGVMSGSSLSQPAKDLKPKREM